MGPLVVVMGWMMIGSIVFVPLFIIAFFMLRSGARAFVLSAAFTAGAVIGLFAAFVVPQIVSKTFDVTNTLHPPWMAPTLAILYVSAAMIGGGVLAVFLLGKLSKYPPWRRY